MSLGRACGYLLGFSLVLAACRTSSEGSSKAGAGSPSANGSATPAASPLARAEQQRDSAAVPIDALISPKVEARRAAVRTLARIADPASFELLLKAISDEDGQVLSWAAFGVGELCAGRELQAASALAVRAASLATLPPSDETDRAIAALAVALGHCADDDAEHTLRSWLTLRPSIAGAAALGLGQLARARQRLDDASVASLLDLAASSKNGQPLYALESLPTLGPAARSRLLEVGRTLLATPSPTRHFAVRAMAKAGIEASLPLRELIASKEANDAERTDAARALAALGSSAQDALLEALSERARVLIDGKAWVSSQHGVVLTLLDGLDPKHTSADVMKELARLPLEGEPPAVVRRKVQLRCRAASLLAGRSSLAPDLLACDPAPEAERREGNLAVLKVLGRGPLGEKRSPRFLELLRSPDRVVREAALELLMTHDELPNTPELLASALGDSAPGVQATAAKVLARYPARATPPQPGDAPPTAGSPDPRVVQALSKLLNQPGESRDIEVTSWFLDAAAALQLLSAKPALERACASTNPTLRSHAERGFATLGDPKQRCGFVKNHEDWHAAPPAHYRVDLETDVGPLQLELDAAESPLAVTRFRELAERGFYDGMLIHRVVPGFVVQFGDPNGDGFGGAELPPLRCELGPAPFEQGSVGVALAGRDTGSSQFFVTLRNTPHLVGEYGLVGKAEAGWERLSVGDRILKLRIAVITP